VLSRADVKEVISTISFNSGESAVATEIDDVREDDIPVKFEFRLAISSVALLVSVAWTVPPPNMLENTLGAAGAATGAAAAGAAIDYLS
jgi:hypothetical protein